jgi:hypothetical protein
MAGVLSRTYYGEPKAPRPPLLEEWLRDLFAGRSLNQYIADVRKNGPDDETIKLNRRMNSRARPDVFDSDTGERTGPPSKNPDPRFLSPTEMDSDLAQYFRKVDEGLSIADLKALREAMLSSWKK